MSKFSPIGADGDHVDIYLGPHIKSPKVWVVDQKVAETGKFDEHKAFIGFSSIQQVTKAYRAAFSDGKADDRLGHIGEMSVSDFKEWLNSGDTTKPVALASQKIGRDSFLYLDGSSDTFAQCGSCVFGRDKCGIMGGQKVSAKDGSCGFYMKGVQINRVVANLTREQTGYVERQVRCHNCKYGGSNCELYTMLNKEFPDVFDLEEKISPNACCNAQTAKG